MIGISTQTYDIIGAWLFMNTDHDNDMKNRSGGRRVSRTATLDGGATVYDAGYSDGDRTINAVENWASEAAVAFARYIVEHYTSVAVTTEDGAYKAVPSSYQLNNGNLRMELLITEKLSE